MNRFFTLSLLSLAFAASASAANFGVYGGWNSADVISDPTVDDESGFVIGGTVGSATSVEGLEVQLDVSFRQADVTVDPCACFPIAASHETFAVLGNLVYTLPTKSWPVHPFVKAGVGYANNSGTFENLSLATVSSSGFAWNVGGGLSAEVAPGISATVGYTFLKTDSIEVLGTELSDGSNHAVTVGLTFAL